MIESTVAAAPLPGASCGAVEEWGIAAGATTTGLTAAPLAGRADFQPSPEEPDASCASFCQQVVDDLSGQLAEFESRCSGLDFYQCKAMLDHFDRVVSYVDALTERAKVSLKSQLCELQAESVKIICQLRSICGEIEDCVERSRPALTAAQEQAVTAILAGIGEEGQRHAVYELLAGHEALQAVLRQQERLSSLCRHNGNRLRDLQEDATSYINLSATVRVLVAQSYARLGFADLAQSIKIEAGLITCRLPATQVKVANGCRTDHLFAQMLEELIKFKQTYGHCDVPRRFKGNLQLGVWTANLRARRKRGLVSPERIAQLDELGFCWSSSRSLWQARFDQLAAFIRKHGHSLVPIDYEAAPYLGVWVRNLRKEVRRSAVSAERVRQLEAIGFDFEVLDLKWQDKYQQLMQFKQVHGHCRVPHRWLDNRSLARWVNVQREQKRLGRISPARYQLLVRAGFEFDPARGRPSSKAGEPYESESCTMLELK